MNTLIYYSFNLMILSAVILIVGLIKPKWLFFWMDAPSRLAAMALALAVFMIAGTMYGEGNRQLKQETAKAATSNAATAAPSADVPAEPAPTVSKDAPGGASPSSSPQPATAPVPNAAQP